jgi:NADH-quinone oxidoreductase subunit J
VKTFDLAFFGLTTLLVLLGGLGTVASKNPIRSAMGLLVSIVGIAGMFLLLSAEFLAAIQILVYAGAVVVLFLFVIMLLGPAATSPTDARSAISRYTGAAAFLVSAVGVLALVLRAAKGATTTFAPAPPGLGTIEAIGRELFSADIAPLEFSGALLLVAIVGAVALARGKHADPTLAPAPRDDAAPRPSAAKPAPAGRRPAPKEAHS